MITFDYEWGPLIAANAGTHFNPVCDRVVARLKRLPDGDYDILGGSIFQNYTHESIGMHVASFAPRWINRELLYITFGYAFHQLGVNRVFGQVPADNEKALAFDLNLGFRVISTIKGVYPGGVDCHVVCMEKSECRFLERPRNSLSNLAA